MGHTHEQREEETKPNKWLIVPEETQKAPEQKENPRTPQTAECVMHTSPCPSRAYDVISAG